MNELSYSLGVNTAYGLAHEGYTIEDFESFLEGFKDLMLNKGLKMEPQNINETIQKEHARVQEEKHKGVIEESKMFLAENAKRKEIKVLASGLQYEVMVEGTGAKPKASDTVTTHYHGTLPNGTVFDSSVKRGQPASFPVNGVIKGWVEALQLMPCGSKWKLYIPSDLAYGAQGAGGLIPPHQALVFEVELLSIA